MKAAVLTGGKGILRTWRNFREKRIRKKGQRKAESPKVWKKMSAKWAPMKPARLVAFEGPEIRLLKDGSSGLKDRRLKARRTARAKKTTPRISLFRPDLDEEDAFAIVKRRIQPQRPQRPRRSGDLKETT
jgi:hypothetical protein